MKGELEMVSEDLHHYLVRFPYMHISYLIGKDRIKVHSDGSADFAPELPKTDGELYDDFITRFGNQKRSPDSLSLLYARRVSRFCGYDKMWKERTEPVKWKRYKPPKWKMACYWFDFRTKKFTKVKTP